MIPIKDNNYSLYMNHKFIDEIKNLLRKERDNQFLTTLEKIRVREYAEKIRNKRKK